MNHSVNFPKDTPQPNRKKNRQPHAGWLYIFIISVAILILLALNKLIKGTWDWPAFNIFLFLAIVAAVFWQSSRLRRSVATIIGESPPRPHFIPRFYSALILLLPFALYSLQLGSQESLPSNMNIIIIAPTLGGLIFVGSGNRRMKKEGRFALLSVVRKLVVSTIALVIFVPLIFNVELLGGIDASTIDFSPLGFYRGACFWSAAILFYLGVYLFLLGLIDLILALRVLKA